MSGSPALSQALMAAQYVITIGSRPRRITITVKATRPQTEQEWMRCERACQLRATTEHQHLSG